MGPATNQPPINLIEYVWPCSHYENVQVRQAPGIPFVRGRFSLPVAKPPDEFTEEDRTGVPARRECCKCWTSSSLFKQLDACEECDHPFAGCPTCMIVDSTGSREIATLDLRPLGEFDQTPQYWRCDRCEHVNPFDSESPLTGFLAPKIAGHSDSIECRQCAAPFSPDSWVINPHWVYLGTWNGKVVAEGGPWHWNVQWHQTFAGEDHLKNDCYAPRRNGRRRRENPCIERDPPCGEPTATGTRHHAVPPILVVQDAGQGMPPPSAGLTPAQEGPDYTRLHPDNQTVGTGVFTIGDYASQMAPPSDDLGSYYNAPAYSQNGSSPEGDHDGQSEMAGPGARSLAGIPEDGNYTVPFNRFAVLARPDALNPEGMPHKLSLYTQRSSAVPPVSASPVANGQPDMSVPDEMVEGERGTCSDGEEYLPDPEDQQSFHGQDADDHSVYSGEDGPDGQEPRTEGPLPDETFEAEQVDRSPEGHDKHAEFDPSAVDGQRGPEDEFLPDGGDQPGDFNPGMADGEQQPGPEDEFSPEGEAPPPNDQDEQPDIGDGWGWFFPSGEDGLATFGDAPEFMPPPDDTEFFPDGDRGIPEGEGEFIPDGEEQPFLDCQDELETEVDPMFSPFMDGWFIPACDLDFFEVEDLEGWFLPGGESEFPGIEVCDFFLVEDEPLEPADGERGLPEGEGEFLPEGEVPPQEEFLPEGEGEFLPDGPDGKRALLDGEASNGRGTAFSGR
ncbi:hypothetical protein VTJ49DRAFT_6260 [Mycothermus thermophilus]|uniref:Uncharacterized protein n=1 Tax=Humicola insolens TaxID=85995 RepID=A0ABR3V1K4_HUMIN